MRSLSHLQKSICNICTIALLFIGFNIFASGLFTALSKGVVSAVLAFSRSFVFMLITMIVLPLIPGVNGIWLATPAAELIDLYDRLGLPYLNQNIQEVEDEV